MRPALSLTEYSRRQGRGGPAAAPPKQALHDLDCRRITGSVVDVLDRCERRCATRNAVERDGAEAEVKHCVGAVVTDDDGGRIKSWRGIDIDGVAVGKAEVSDFVVTEVGPGTVAEVEHIGAGTACQEI